MKNISLPMEARKVVVGCYTEAVLICDWDIETVNPGQVVNKQTIHWGIRDVVLQKNPDHSLNSQN